MTILVGRTDNKRAADLFYDLALAMELQGERWRANSYYRAAKSIEELGEHLRSVSERGELRRIEGVGESIEAKLEEFLATGRIEALENVRDILPEDLDLLRNIPGLGVRRIAEIEMLLGIRSVDELLRAAYEGKIAELPDFDEGVDRKVIEYLTWKREEAAEVPTPYAIRSAKRIIDYLQGSPGLIRLELSGPARRKASSVANITLLFTATEPDGIIARFGLCPEITELIIVEKEQAVGKTTSGAACMVRAVREESFGLDLLKSTGPDAHIRSLGKLAKERGLRLTAARLGKDRARTEQAIYDALGMEPVRPEWRGFPPCECVVLPEELRGDLHLRCVSFDGGLRVLEMASAAHDLGHRYVCFCDRLGGRYMDPEALERRNILIDEAADLLGIPILKGAEVDITPDGRLDFPTEHLERLDLVIGSVNARLNMDSKAMTSRVLTAMGDPNMDVFGHPLGRILGLREPIRLDMNRIAEAACDRKVALEVNAYPDRLDLDAEAIRAIGDTKNMFSLGTDAAFPSELTYWEWAANMAMGACLPPSRVLNTLSAEQLRGRRWRK